MVHRLVKPLIAGIFCLIGWELISLTAIIPPSLFPPPAQVILSLLKLFSQGFLGDIAISAARVLAGLSIGAILGILAGVCTGRINAIDEYVSPIIHMARAFPPVALIPVIIIWVGIGEGAKILSISLAVFFSVWINAHSGARQIPVHFIWAVKTMTCSRFRIWQKVIIPASFPFCIAGIRNGVAIAFVMAYVSELAGASRGIGYQISVAHLNYAMDQMFAALLVLGLLAAITDHLVVKIVGRCAPWITM